MLCCPIVQKGADDFQTEEYHRYPMICINEHSRKVKAYVSLVDDKEFKDGIWTESIGRIPLERWTHVAFTMSSNKLSIFINGIRDSLQLIESRPFQVNNQPLYIGGSPSYQKACKLAYYLKDLKVYNIELPAFSIEAEAAGSLGIMEANSMMIGCINCGYKKAAQKCISGYHLCTNIEIYSGAYQIIRVMGWDLKSAHIVSDNEYDRKQNIKGTAFCCRNYLS